MSIGHPYFENQRSSTQSCSPPRSSITQYLPYLLCHSHRWLSVTVPCMLRISKLLLLRAAGSSYRRTSTNTIHIRFKEALHIQYHPPSLQGKPTANAIHILAQDTRNANPLNMLGQISSTISHSYHPHTTATPTSSTVAQSFMAQTNTFAGWSWVILVIIGCLNLMGLLGLLIFQCLVNKRLKKAKKEDKGEDDDNDNEVGRGQHSGHSANQSRFRR
jgi:hypothetical protein